MNLGLSFRGMQSLELIGAHEVIYSNSVKVDGRIVIKKDGSHSFHYYAKRDNIIYMINRENLANLLVNKVKSLGKAQILFNTKVNDVDLRK